ncbi:MAG: spermidine/putrescine ABC transporter ATP-binding protein PotA [Corallincola sp.]|nr:spermidine/putrescine ABC transporter ATP-binding protein PotA [Corallincola sp.]
MNAASPLIQISGLTKSYQGKQVIRNLELTIFDGEFLTLLGPSGCGKTTVLRILAGFEGVDCGRVTLDGQDLLNLPAERRPVNTVFQSYALFPHMSVWDNVAFGLRMKKVPAAEIKARVDALLETVQLSHLAQRMPNQLSGGQQQRVAIARAVVNKPRLLLLDESLSALDYKLRKQMQVELKKIQRQLGITFVFVTHDQEEALSMSDRVAVMQEGRIVQLGTPRSIYEEPATLFVARFVGESNVFDATMVSRIDERHARVALEGDECVIDDGGRFAPGDRLHVMLRPEDLRIGEMTNGQLPEGLRGTVVERNYKGATLESIIRLANGTEVIASEFFDEDDPSFDHSLGQQVAVTWVPSWEVVLPYEQ